MLPELVILVDEQNHVVGALPKSAVHTNNTPLHRGFSLFLFNSKNQLLLQQRSHFKKTWPLIWSNSICGHPGVGESNVAAARRRLKHELGITQTKIKEIAPYKYKFIQDGVMENEICPILVGHSDQTPQPNPNEVETIKWISWPNWLTEIKAHPHKYSPWCIEETHILTRLLQPHGKINPKLLS